METIALGLGMDSVDDIEIIDKLDLCCAYIHGFVNGSGHCENGKQIAIHISHILIRHGFQLRDDILNGLVKSNNNEDIRLQFE